MPWRRRNSSRTPVTSWVVEPPKQNLAFRWLVYLALFLAVLVLGRYGPGYNAADFIYAGF